MFPRILKFDLSAPGFSRTKKDIKSNSSILNSLFITLPNVKKPGDSEEY